jgi:hypothetical protein
MNIIILIIFSILLFMLLNKSDKNCESFILSSAQFTTCKTGGCPINDDKSACPPCIK